MRLAGVARKSPRKGGGREGWGKQREEEKDNKARGTGQEQGPQEGTS